MPDLGVAVLYPELLGLYADGGNALAFRYRARLHGLDAEIVDVHPGDTVPTTADFYVLGGAEDAAMTAALALLQAQPGLGRALEGGASVLGICGGYQLLGRSFTAPNGRSIEGLGHLDVESHRLPGERAVGEIAVSSPILGELQGFENHRGDARLGPAARPLGTVVHGIGNAHGGTEGAVQGRVVGTYMHGPALVRNPALADFFLQQITGRDLEPVCDELVEQLRAERRRAISRRPRWRRRP